MAKPSRHFDINVLFEHENDADDELNTQSSFDSVERLQDCIRKLEPSVSGMEGLNSYYGNTNAANQSPSDSEGWPLFDSVFDSEVDDHDNRLREDSNSVFYKTKYEKPKLAEIGTSNSNFSNSTTSTSSESLDPDRQNRKRSAVDGLLFEIYERYSSREVGRSNDSDNITECSTTSSCLCFASSLEMDEHVEKLDSSYLQTKEICDLERMVKELKRISNMMSSKLVKLLKQRDRNAHKLQQNFDILTAILQAVSLKRRVDTRIRFSFIPSPGKKGFRQWHDAFKSIARLSTGILTQWRRRTWIALAEYFLKGEDWNKLKHNCFNDRRNPDDDELDTQIVKDLHRTGCGWFFARDTEDERASLKRVLLAYARWNKSVGYCQGFNVIAALILQVMEGSEEDALKVMIYLVDFILPRNYFANNLRALSADMAVLRELMSIKLPHLSQHLDILQQESIKSQKPSSGDYSYEPPLVNVFTMQWFLTLFATCLPRETVLRVWDAVLLEGSEVLLRVALAVWAKLADYLDNTKTAADFYMEMGSMLRNLMNEDFIHAQKLMETVFTMAPFPYRKIAELREKYTYDIHPFSTFDKGSLEENFVGNQAFLDATSDEDGDDSEADNAVIGCLSFLPVTASELNNASILSHSASSKTDIAAATPGAVGTDPESQSAFSKERAEAEKLREKEKLDLILLKKQYLRMRKLQKNHMLVFNSFSTQNSGRKVNSSRAINHLFVDKPNIERGHKDGKQEIPPNRYLVDSNLARNSAVPMILKYELKAERKHSQKANQNSGVKNFGQKTSQLCSQLSPQVRRDEPVIRCKSASTKSRNSCFVSRYSYKNKDDDPDSPCFKVDKNAMYPVNFKPFPRRSHSFRTKSTLIRNTDNNKSE